MPKKLILDTYEPQYNGQSNLTSSPLTKKRLSFDGPDPMAPETVMDDKQNFFDSLPLVFKQAYNQSIGGMMYEITHGKKRFNLMEAPESMVRDVAAGIFSFFASPTDLAVTVGTAGVGSWAAKAGAKAAFGLAGRKGIEKTAISRAGILLSKKSNLSRKTATSLVQNVVEQGLPQAFMLGTYDGLYDAAKTARDEILAAGIDPAEYEELSKTDALGLVMKNAKLSKFAKSAALGLGAGTSRTLSQVPGIGKLSKSGLGFEIASFSAFSPVVYEGRAPEFEDFAMGAGLIMGLKVPKKIGKFMKDTKELKQAQEVIADETLLRESAYESYFKDKESKTGSGGVIVYEQKGGIRTTGGRADKLIGKEISEVFPETGKPSKKTVSTEDTVIADFRAGSEAIIVKGSEKFTDTGMTMEIQLTKGKKGTEMTKYYLDEKNTEKFFDFFIESDTPTLAGLTDDAQKIYIDELAKKNPKVARTINQSRWNLAVSDAVSEGVENFNKEDVLNALKDTVNQLDNKIVKSGQKGSMGSELIKKAIDEDTILDFDVNKLSSAELKILADNLQAQKYINEFVENAKKLDINLTFVNPNAQSKGTFSNVLRGFAPFYNQLTDPYARKLVRLINNVNQATQQKTSTRLNELAKIMNIAKKAPKPVQEAYETYLKGTGNISAFNDYRAISAKHAKLVSEGKNIKMGVNDGHTLYVQELEKELADAVKSKKFTYNEEMSFRNRINFIKGMKSITDEVYADAQTALPSLAPFEVGYAPIVLRREVLDILFDGSKNIDEKITKMLKDDFEILPKINGEYTDEIKVEINNIIKSTLKKFEVSGNEKQREFASIFKAFKNNVSGNGQKTFKDDLSLHYLMQLQINNKTLKPYALLERPRKTFSNFDLADVDLVNMATKNFRENMIERDMRRVFGEYLGGASKRIELAKAFTHDGTYYNALLKRIDGDIKMPWANAPKILGGGKIPFMKQTEREAVNIIKESFTGEINFNPNYKGNMAEVFQTIGNLEMMGKISFGFAVIPNLTQTVISTAVELGPITTLKSLVKLYGPFADKDLRERVAQSGATLLSTIEEMMTVNPALSTSIDRSLKMEAPWKSFLKGQMGLKGGIEFLTTKTAKPFSKINEINQTIAAASAEEMVKKLGKVLRGDKVGLLDNLAPSQRKAWATKKLQRMGLDPKEVVDNLDMIISGRYDTVTKEILKGRTVQVMNPMKEKMLRSMQRFSLNSQLQRDFMLDPFLFNDPELKPLFLFKRFGYRQTTYLGRVLRDEIADGNFTPLLTLGIGGLAGGQFVMWSKEKLQEFITGEKEYYSKEERLNMLKQPEWNDFVNRLTSVGAFGVLGDIMTDENPMQSIQFFLKPVVIDDIQRLGRSFDAFVGSMQTQYPENWDVPFRKAAVIAAPVAGGIAGRLTRRLVATEKMDKDRVRARKRDAVRDIKDAVISGDSRAAARIMNEYNSTYAGRYPSLRITPKDVSYSAILKDKVERLKKQREEVEYKP